MATHVKSEPVDGVMIEGRDCSKQCGSSHWKSSWSEELLQTYQDFSEDHLEIKWKASREYHGKQTWRKIKCFEEPETDVNCICIDINTCRFAHHEHKTDSRIVAESCCLSNIQHSIKQRQGANSVNFLNEERCLEILVQVVTLAKFLCTFWLYLGFYYSIYLFY